VPLQKLAFRPGVSRESTNLANEGSFYACDKVRFRSGQPEKIGGWTRYSEGTFLGICRNLAEWESLSSYLLLGLGTHLKYYILSNQTFYDITPLRLTIDPLPDDTTGVSPFYPLFSTLSSGISANATAIVVASGTSFGLAFPVVVRIGAEDIYVENVSGNTFTGCVRGYNGTTAATHSSGVNVTSSWIAVKCNAHGAGIFDEQGDFVTLSGATAFGPYTADDLNGNFAVKALSTDYILVDVGVQSTSVTAGGGTAVKAEFEIYTGAAIASFGAGWGAGVWTSLTYAAGVTVLSSTINSTVTTLSVTSTSSFGATSSTGSLLVDAEVMTYTVTNSTTLTVVRSIINPTSHSAGATVQQVSSSALTSRPWNRPATTGTSIPLRLWSSDVFGQDLVFNVRNGGVYYWTASSGLNAAGNVDERGVDITDLPGVDDGWRPSIASRVIVTDERHIVVLGTNDPLGANPAAQDPLLIRWCEQEDPIIWEPTATNTAGFQRLTYGSRIITAEKTRQEILVWTDMALYSMRYLGPPYTFGFNTLSAEINIASPNAIITANNITYWMGTDKFYAYSGRVDTLPCALRQYIFSDINLLQIEQIYAGGNEKYNEVWWFYPSSESDQNNRYIVYNYLEKIWYYGELPRSAWYDSHIRTYPLATEEGVLFYHEFGVDDATDPVNPAPIDCYIQSADFDIGEGDSFSFIKRFIPDIDFIGSQVQTPSVNVDISVRDFPGQGSYTHTDATITNANRASLQVYDYTQDFWIRLRGRQAAFRIGSDALGVQWQSGVNRIDIQPDGRKGR
jgi:hypothetical protein